jgi:hypothetical protein
MSDYDQFRSDSTQYDFSKGPKSLYVPLSDGSSTGSLLDGVVLNVPQTDTDDEWGGTDRIALERIVDKVGKLEYEVEDPHGSGAGGLLNKMSSLVGTSLSSFSYPFINMSVPSLTLGTVLINGTLNTISIGTTTELTAESLMIGTDFLIATAGVLATIQYFNNRIDIYDDSVSTHYINLYVNGGTRFSLTDTNLNIVVGTTNITGTLSVAGTVSLGNVSVGGSINLSIATVQGDIVPSTGSTFNIGLTTQKYKNIYLSEGVHADYAIFTNNINVGTILSSSNMTTPVLFGDPVLNTLYIYSSNITIRGTGSSGTVLIQGQGVGGSVTIGMLSSNSITFSTNPSAQLLPDTTNTIDIGSSGKSFNDIYGKNINALTRLSTPEVLTLAIGSWSSSLNITAPQVDIITSVSLGLGLGSYRVTLSSSGLIPDVGYSVDLGTAIKGFNNLYCSSVNVSSLTVSGSSSLGDSFSTVTINGTLNTNAGGFGVLTTTVLTVNSSASISGALTAATLNVTGNINASTLHLSSADQTVGFGSAGISLVTTTINGIILHAIQIGLQTANLYLPNITGHTAGSLFVPLLIDTNLGGGYGHVYYQT